MLFVSLYRLYLRVRAKAFSLLISSACEKFGSGTTVMPPLRLIGEKHIAIGSGVFIGPGSWLQVMHQSGVSGTVISIGDGTSIVGDCVISAAKSVRIEKHVLMARNVYISDHIHKYTQTDRPIMEQGIDKISPVWIKTGAWLGQNVVICPGVTIGAGSVVGANSVVKINVPDYCIAVGSPARIVKMIRKEDRAFSV
jgi:acetyltransferase-like isoleucine patch superfamily enzyme